MQKKIIALAIAGLASTAAFAQSNVTIYGRADYGFMQRSGDSGAVLDRDSKNEMQQGLGAGSRIGFKGSEDLGNGTKAIFQFEYGTGLDEPTQGAARGGGLSTLRNAHVGLTNDKWGTFIGGRLDGVRYGIFNKYDAFGGGNMGNFTQMTAQVDRANNALAYVSPKFGGGFTLVGAYSTDVGVVTDGFENAGNDNDGRLTTLMLNYANGPLDISADWEKVHYNHPNTAANGMAGAFDWTRVMTLGASYNFGFMKLSGLIDNLKTDNQGGGTASDVDSWFISASVPYNNFVFKATYGRTDDDQINNNTSRKFGVGFDYNLSKRTKFYATYGNIDNSNGAAREISPAANNSAAVGRGVYGTQGYDVGIAHTF